MSYISAIVRQRVADASRFRCGYCLTSQTIVGPLLEIDHIVPESKGGSDAEENLTLACPICNSHKADHIAAIDPVTQTQAALFNPRTDHWREHFDWQSDGTEIQGLTPQGRATVLALNMNDTAIVAARRLWVLAGWHPPGD